MIMMNKAKFELTQVNQETKVSMGAKDLPCPRVQSSQREVFKGIDVLFANL